MDDPLLLSQGFDETLRAQMQHGRAVRERRLREAAARLDRSGMLSRPMQWARRQYEVRLRQARAQMYDAPLSSAQVARIESQARVRLRSEQPTLQDSDPNYKREFHRVMQDIASNVRSQSRRPERLFDEAVTERWRQTMIDQLQENFRRSLGAILRNGRGRLVATSRFEDDLFLIREQDLNSIRVIPTPSLSPADVRVEWNGRILRLNNVSNSLEEIRSPITDLQNNAAEIASLTLGAQIEIEGRHQRRILN